MKGWMISILFVFVVSAGFGQRYKKVIRTIDLNLPQNSVLNNIIGPGNDTISIVNFILVHIRDGSLPIYKRAFDTVSIELGNISFPDSIAPILLDGDTWRMEGSFMKVHLDELALADPNDDDRSICWVKMKDLLPLIENYRVQVPNKPGEMMSMGDFFRDRYFKSDLKEMGPWQE